jgi:hypothetical protein
LTLSLTIDWIGPAVRVKKVQTVVGLEPERFERVVAMAKAEGVLRAEMVRILVGEALAAHDKRPKRGPLAPLAGHVAVVINFPPPLYKRFMDLAESEDRPMGHMFRILIADALDARERLARKTA